MRNQKWNQFDFWDQEIPATHLEAAIFVYHALSHLSNRIDGPLGEDFRILNGAHQAINEELYKGAA